MSAKLSPVKRSSRTPKLSAKMIALEAEVSQKKRQKPSEQKEKASTPPTVTPTVTPTKVSKPKTPTSGGSSSRKRKSTPMSKKTAKTNSSKSAQKDVGRSPAAEIDIVSAEQMSPLKHLAQSMMYEEENDLDVTQFTDSGPLVVDDTSNTTSTLAAFPTCSNSAGNAFDKKLQKKSKPEGNSDDEAEEKWLQALESGKLEEIDSELKSMKDPRLMTARQRAVIEAKQAKVEQLQKFHAMQEALKDQLAAEVLSDEILEKKAQKAAKRKQLAEEKRDKEKKDTIKRLLKKADSRQKLKKLQRQKAQLIPKVSYRYDCRGMTVSFPAEMTPQSLGLDLEPKRVQYPATVLCSNPGCTQVKKFQCSSNGFPVCGLQCYKQVVSLPPLSQLLDVANVSAGAEGVAVGAEGVAVGAEEVAVGAEEVAVGAEEVAVDT